MQRKDLKKAVGYLRTSSAANVGNDKDSEKRQREAIEAYARSAGVEIAEWFYDAAVSGADPIEARPGFQAMLDRLLGNGVRMVLVENASRFARDLLIQETGHAMLRQQGIELVAVDQPGAFLDDGPTAVMVRQILGAVSQFEKAMMVAKLRGARERKRARTGQKVEGRKNLQELRPDTVALARKLFRYPVKGKRRSLRQVAAALAEAGHTTPNGKHYSTNAITRMVKG